MIGGISSVLFTQHFKTVYPHCGIHRYLLHDIRYDPVDGSSTCPCTSFLSYVPEQTGLYIHRQWGKPGQPCR